MLYQKIFVTELKIKSELKKNREKLATMERIKDFLSRVDHEVEFIAVSNRNDLEGLVSDLKGEGLNEEEKAMIGEIFNAHAN